jgi:uncharacterized protein (TIGR00369 family)
MDFSRLKRLMEDEIPFNRVLGLRLVAATEKMVRLEITFRPELVGDPLRPALHGGVLSAAADTAGGAAVWVGHGDDVRISTIDLRIDYLRPARLETVIVEAHVVRSGNRVGVVDVRLFHAGAESETIATGKGVYNIKKARRPGD